MGRHEMIKKKEYWTSPSGVTYEIGAPWPPSNFEKKLGYVWVPKNIGYKDRLGYGTLDDAAERIHQANNAQHDILKTKEN